MVLNLPHLRADYKATYKSNWPLAEKINILIEVKKIEMNYRSQMAQSAKRIKVAKILQSANISLRTLQRWKPL